MPLNRGGSHEGTSQVMPLGNSVREPEHFFIEYYPRTWIEMQLSVSVIEADEDNGLTTKKSG